MKILLGVALGIAFIAWSLMVFIFGTAFGEAEVIKGNVKIERNKEDE